MVRSPNVDTMRDKLFKNKGHWDRVDTSNTELDKIIKTATRSGTRVPAKPQNRGHPHQDNNVIPGQNKETFDSGSVKLGLCIGQGGNCFDSWTHHLIKGGMWTHQGR